MKIKYAVAMAAALLAVQAQAADASHTELKDCAIQEVLPGKDMTGAFARIVHTGPAVDVVKAEVPSVSQRIELHSMVMKDGVMTMTQMTDVKINAGERVFKKGGDHVMLFDVAKKPEIGSKHTMTLYFSDNTKASCEAVVKSVQDVMKDAGIDPNSAHDAHGGGHGKH